MASNNNKVYIIKGFEFKIFSKNEFDDFIGKFRKIKFLGKKFKTPKEFEPNFEKYFSFGNQLMKMPFIIYGDREIFIDNILNSEIGKNKRYYGLAGIGKSVSLIGAIKYNFDISNLKLYINCKYMHKLSKNSEFLKIKQNLIDEIPFLFFEDYDNYFKAANEIKNYPIENEMVENYWDLIEFLLKLIKSWD